MIAGYARVSTKEQNLEAQIATLRALGCDAIYTDQVSGKTMQRDGLAACLKSLEKGDTLVVQAFDRLGRNVADLLAISAQLKERGVELRSIRENIDTSTPMGSMFFSICISFAQFERDIISERTKIGLDAARAQGRVGGRPKALTPQQHGEIEATIIGTSFSFVKIAKDHGVSKSTLYKAFPGGRGALVKARFEIISDFTVLEEHYQIVRNRKSKAFFWRLRGKTEAEHCGVVGPFDTAQAASEDLENGMARV